MQLYETNKQLRALAAEELDQPETRRRDREPGRGRAGQRPAALGPGRSSGEDLVRQAMRNPEFGVGHLEKWAEMLQILKDISGNRMPSVADLLKQAAQAPSVAANSPSQQDADGRPGPRARARASRPRRRKTAEAAAGRPAGRRPRVVAAAADEEGRPSAAQERQPRRPGSRLPVTTLVGRPEQAEPDPPPPAEQKVDEAVVKQQDLLAEFEKIADELNRVLANLEGSTLVKRLKAASRLQYKIARPDQRPASATPSACPSRRSPARAGEGARRDGRAGGARAATTSR